MNAKEKAQELLNKMSCQTYSFQEYAGAHYLTEEVGWEAGKKCALIAVQMSIEELDNYNRAGTMQSRIKFLQEVQQELENL